MTIMNNPPILIFILISLFSFPSFANSDVCSSLNHCDVIKTQWTKEGWETVYKKELKFEKFCKSERPLLQLEKELGLELWLFNGDEQKKDSFKSRPYVTANLYTYKLTYVVATASMPVENQFLNFSYRLSPKGQTIIEVTCSKK
jgi:hypothetical protein